MTFSKRLQTACSAGALALLFTLGASIASADTFSSTLSFTNFNNPPAGPYGTVLVTFNGGTTATIQFTAGSGYVFGDGSSVDANGNFTLTGITGNCALCTYTDGGTGNVDGIGSFAAEVNSGNFSPSASSTVITMTVTDTGTAWTSASQVLTANAAGYDAGAHVFSNAGATTFFVGEPAGGSAVPEPGALGLLGAGLIGIGALMRCRPNRVAGQH
jgi:hypothetical protein